MLLPPDEREEEEDGAAVAGEKIEASDLGLDDEGGGEGRDGVGAFDGN